MLWLLIKGKSPNPWDAPDGRVDRAAESVDGDRILCHYVHTFVLHRGDELHFDVEVGFIVAGVSLDPYEQNAVRGERAVGVIFQLHCRYARRDGVSAQAVPSAPVEDPVVGRYGLIDGHYAQRDCHAEAGGLR